MTEDFRQSKEYLETNGKVLVDTQSQTIDGETYNLYEKPPKNFELIELYIEQNGALLLDLDYKGD